MTGAGPSGNAQTPAHAQAGSPPKTLPIVALVLGVASVVGVFLLSIVTAVLLALAAVVVGWVALVQVRRGTAQGRGKAIAGIVLGSIGVLLAIAAMATFFLGLGV